MCQLPHLNDDRFRPAPHRHSDAALPTKPLPRPPRLDIRTDANREREKGITRSLVTVLERGCATPKRRFSDRAIHYPLELGNLRPRRSAFAEMCVEGPLLFFKPSQRRIPQAHVSGVKAS